MEKNDIQITIFDDSRPGSITTGMPQESPAEQDGTTPGDTIITDDVIAVVAAQAALGTRSVAGMESNIAGDIAEVFGVKNPAKGVAVKMDEDRVILDLYVVVYYGSKISDIAWEIQENVKRDVENMTGAIVESVNVHVSGIDFSQTKN